MSTEVQQSHTGDWVWAALSVAYLFSPVDSSQALVQIVKMFKWGLIILGIICIALILLLGTLIVKMFSN